MNASDIKISTKRVGGGFGGKGRPSDIVAIAAAIGAKISGRRVVMEIPLRHSHQINGGRPEARSDYRAVFDKESKLLKSLHIDLYVDCGYSCNDGKVYNFCMNTLRALGQGPYAIENVHWNVSLVKTNKPLVVAMRGPGEVIPLYILEAIFDRAAIELEIDHAEIRQKNLNFGKTDSIGTVATHRSIETFNAVKNEASYEQLEQETREFNKLNTWKKRGLSVTPLRSRWANVGCYGSARSFDHFLFQIRKK